MYEPFSALDAGLRATLRQDVTTMLEQIGATAIIVTHDQEEALSMADLVAVMRHGECVQRSEEHTSELQSRGHLVCRLLLDKKKNEHMQTVHERTLMRVSVL